MLAGQGQVYEDMSTPSLLKQAGQHFNVENQLSTSPYDLQLNTRSPPFNNKLARQAIYAATNFAPILQHVFSNLYPVTQGFTGPGGICYQPNVPGYPPYDLAKAKALVKQLGGLTVNLGTIQNLVAQETTEALQTEWAAAGIKTTIANYPLAGLIAQFTSKQVAGDGADRGRLRPGGRRRRRLPVLLASRRSAGCTTRTWTRCSTRPRRVSLSQRCALYNQAAAYIAQQYYGPFYFGFAPANVAVKGVTGPGLTEPLPAVVVTPTDLVGGRGEQQLIRPWR